jgi:hypothetical protein
MRLPLVVSIAATWMLSVPSSLGCGGSITPNEECDVAADCERGSACVAGACVLSAGVDAGGELPIGDGDGDVDDAGALCTVDNETTACGADSYCIDGACALRPLCGPAGECPVGLVCNPIEGRCARAVECEGTGCDCTASTCDDSLFCNGSEACVVGTGCLVGTPPCGGGTPVCDESSDRCVECLSPSDCGGAACVDERCACVPVCTDRECGPDGCGGSCGTCPLNDVCGDDGQCGCIADCGARECGSDGCGGSCGTCTGSDLCVDGTCECVPQCAGNTCGSDGCGGSCGTCTGADLCVDGTCECVPQCAGKECGNDGCGGTCGGCEANETCTNGQCTCVPSCTGKECGNDGCGGSCGLCAAFETCSGAGQCVTDGTVCDYFVDGDVLPAFATANGALSSLDEAFEWDGRPVRFIDNLGILATKESTTTLSLVSAAFDTYLYVYRVDGQCTQVAKNDDVTGGGTNSSLTVTIADTGLYEVVVTSFFGSVTGDYTLSSTTDLCGLEVDAATYAKCAPVVAAQATPCQNNPCLPDTPVANNEFCCINATCRSGYSTGETIQTFTSAVCGPDP